MTYMYTMTLAGSIAVAVYMLLYFPAVRMLPVLWHKIYLTVAIVLFITPFPYIKTDYIMWLEKCFRWKDSGYGGNGFTDASNYSVLVYNDSIYVHNPWLYILLGCCLLISICFLVIGVIKYKNTCFGILSGAVKDVEAGSILDAVCDRTGIHTRAGVYVSSCLHTPVTVGIFRKRIVLPSTDWTKEQLDDIFYHELVHIRMMDNTVKLVLLVVVILNFYNPFVYYLWYKWNLTAELYCDSRVVEGKGLQEKKDYAMMIIALAEGGKRTVLPLSGLSQGQRQIKERIACIMKERKIYGKLSGVFGILVIAAAVFASSLSVYAYEERNVSHFDEQYQGEEVEVWFLEEGADEPFEQDARLSRFEEYITVENDTFFMDGAGNVYSDIDADGKEAVVYGRCSHTYVNGTYARHTKFSDGSCKIDYYEGKRCSKCGDIVFGSLVSTTAYVKCPH